MQKCIKFGIAVIQVAARQIVTFQIVPFQIVTWVPTSTTRPVGIWK